MEKYDVAVIGAGPGGYVAAIRAAQLGFKTVCVEKGKTLGGSCLNVGCIPSKCLLQDTKSYSFLLNDAQKHGVLAQNVSFDFQAMMKRKEQVVFSLVSGIPNLFKNHAITRLEGSARFTSPHTLEIDDGKNKQTIEAENVILATGSEAIPLPGTPFDEKVILSSTGALSLPKVPKKMLVIGAGVIGVELASVYKRLGTEIVIVEMLDRICIAMDHAISKMLMQILQKQGMVFHLGAKVSKINVNPQGATAIVEKEGKAMEFSADVVLVAVGRKPYTEGLDLEKAGVGLNSKGYVVVDQAFRTSQSNIYAIGDLIEGPMLAHRASEEGIAVAEFLAGQNPHVNYMAVPNIIYTHPEAAAVGMTEKEALEAGLKLKIGTAFFKGNPRARCAGDTDGFVKVIGEEASGRLIGMHILGDHASEMIAEGVLAIDRQATLSEVAYASHGHPTLSEAIKEAVMQALGHAIHI